MRFSYLFTLLALLFVSQAHYVAVQGQEANAALERLPTLLIPVLSKIPAALPLVGELFLLHLLCLLMQS